MNLIPKKKQNELQGIIEQRLGNKLGLMQVRQNKIKEPSISLGLYINKIMDKEVDKMKPNEILECLFKGITREEIIEFCDELKEHLLVEFKKEN